MTAPGHTELLLQATAPKQSHGTRPKPPEPNRRNRQGVVKTAQLKDGSVWVMASPDHIAFLASAHQSELPALHGSVLAAFEAGGGAAPEAAAPSGGGGGAEGGVHPMDFQVGPLLNSPVLASLLGAGGPTLVRAYLGALGRACRCRPPAGPIGGARRKKSRARAGRRVADSTSPENARPNVDRRNPNCPQNDGYIMLAIAHHLVGARRLGQLRDLLTSPAWLEVKLHLYGVGPVVDDFRK